jgi:hypothetical protein
MPIVDATSRIRTIITDGNSGVIDVGEGVGVGEGFGVAVEISTGEGVEAGTCVGD